MPKKKGDPKTGGRTSGTKNKLSSGMKGNLLEVLTHYHDSGQFASDFYALEPKERITLSERLMNYYMPKQQATSISVEDETKRKTIEDTLVELSGGA